MGAFVFRKCENMKILIVGDVFSKLGRASLERNIQRIKQEQKINFIIVNGENISHGRGMNEGHYLWLLNQGANVITMGNHTFNQRSIFNYIDDSKCLVRPYNYLDPETKGKGYVTVNYNGIKITVFQMLGQVFMNEEVHSPFLKTEELLKEINSDIIICDFLNQLFLLFQLHNQLLLVSYLDTRELKLFCYIDFLHLDNFLL